MIWVYEAAGLLLFVVAVAIVAGAVQSVRSKGRFRVELDAPEFSGYGGKIHARFDTEQELIRFVVVTYRHTILEPEPREPYDARGHAERIP